MTTGPARKWEGNPNGSLPRTQVGAKPKCALHHIVKLRVANPDHSFVRNFRDPSTAGQDQGPLLPTTESSRFLQCSRQHGVHIILMLTEPSSCPCQVPRHSCVSWFGWKRVVSPRRATGRLSSFCLKRLADSDLRSPPGVCRWSPSHQALPWHPCNGRSLI